MLPPNQRSFFRLAAMIAGWAAAVPGAGAQQADITWSSSFFSTNLDSTDAPLDDSFTFHLGVFDPPLQDPHWTPQPANTAEWAQHWITADVARYDASGNGRFASGYVLEAQVEGVNLDGRKGYIWGVRRTMPGEWILITADSWIWPQFGGLGFPRNWTVNAGTAVLGAVNQDGIHMQTAAVADARPPLLRAEHWRRLHFTQHERDNLESTVSGWLADPNGNGRSNLVEYALGSPPRAPDTRQDLQVSSLALSGSDFLTYAITRDPNSEALLTVQISEFLEQWSPAGSHLVLVNESPGMLFYRASAPLGTGPVRFLRLQVALPPSP